MYSQKKKSSTASSSSMRDASLKKPGETLKWNLKQQSLPAHQPDFLHPTVFLPAVFITGLLFIILGAVFLVASEKVQELELDYTDCMEYPKKNGNKTCADVLQENIKNPCKCKIEFNITESFNKNVNIHYGLNNFYQNLRRYILSQDTNQLQGDTDALLKRCIPFDVDQGKKIAPCGAIANSMFNDTFTLASSSSVGVKITRRGIAWDTDKKRKFKNPSGSLNPNHADFAFKNFTKPPAWSKPIWELDTVDNENNGFMNEDFLVWMRTEAFPNFRKLYGKIDHSIPEFQNGLPKGSYSFMINYNYPVKNINGKKYIVLSNTSFLGGKNRFLGIAYITAGVLTLILGIFLLVAHVKFRKEDKDLQIDRYTPWSCNDNSQKSLLTEN